MDLLAALHVQIEGLEREPVDAYEEVRRIDPVVRLVVARAQFFPKGLLEQEDEPDRGGYLS